MLIDRLVPSEVFSFCLGGMNMKYDGWLTVATGGTIATITYLLGGLDHLMAALAIFLVLDYQQRFIIP